MDKTLIVKSVNEIKTYKGADAKWFIITDAGDRYNHNLPITRININETDNTLDCIYLENSNGPSPTMALVKITMDKIIAIGSFYTDKDECRKMMAGNHINNDDIEKIVDMIYNPPRI